MKSIILWEIRQRRMFILWWTVAIAGIIGLILLLYPSIQQQAAELNKALNELPASLRELRTGGSNVDITSPAGFLNSQLYYVTLPMLFIIMSITLGGSLLARDEQNRTLELLLARPVSRGRLIAAKAVSGLAIVAGITLFSGILTLILARAVGLSIGVLNLAATVLACSLFSATFGMIAFALTAATWVTKRSSVAVSVALSFGGYLLESLSSVSSFIKTPAQFFPYHYYQPIDILTGSIRAGFVVYVVACTLLCALVAWYGFRRRDIA